MVYFCTVLKDSKTFCYHRRAFYMVNQIKALLLVSQMQVSF